MNEIDGGGGGGREVVKSTSTRWGAWEWSENRKHPREEKKALQASLKGDNFLNTKKKNEKKDKRALKDLEWFYRWKKEAYKVTQANTSGWGEREKRLGS